MWRDLFIIRAQHQVESSSLHGDEAAVMRGHKFKRNLVCGWIKLPAENRTKHREGMVPARDAESRFFAGGVKQVSAKKAVEPGKRDFQLAPDGLTFWSQLIARRPADKEVILKHRSQPLQRAAHRRLAQK